MAVARGIADVGVGVRSAAELMGLAFAPLALESDPVRERINALGGYDLSETGAVRRAV